MAVSTCLKCAGHSFELAPFTPLGVSLKLTMVQCSGCGTPIAVLDPATNLQIDSIKNQIAAIPSTFMIVLRCRRIVRWEERPLRLLVIVFLELVVLADRPGAGDRRPRINVLEPALEI
jgi:hypothetical protein